MNHKQLPHYSAAVTEEALKDGKQLINTYSVILPLNEVIALGGLGCHLQPARSACFQLLYLTHADAG